MSCTHWDTRFHLSTYPCRQWFPFIVYFLFTPITKLSLLALLSPTDPAFALPPSLGGVLTIGASALLCFRAVILSDRARISHRGTVWENLMLRMQFELRQIVEYMALWGSILQNMYFQCMNIYCSHLSLDIRLPHCHLLFTPSCPLLSSILPSLLFPSAVGRRLCTLLRSSGGLSSLPLPGSHERERERDRR